MWSTLLRKAILCVFYVLLLYCDVIVLSQRLRIYDALDHDDILSNRRSHSVGNYSNVHSKLDAPTRTPLIHRTKASDDSQYIHGMTYQEHKKVAAASEPYTQYRRHRFQAIDAPSVPSWRVARTTEYPTPGSTTVAEMPHSYFGTTQKPARFDSDSYWPDRYGSRSRVKPTIRVETIVNSTFGQARVETGLKPRNLCCQNETESDGDQGRGRFRFYNSFSRDRGYAPRPALQFVTTTTTTDRPVYRWSDRYGASQGSNSFHERASSLGIGSSRRVVGAQENAIEWTTTRRPYRYYTTTWVPRTTRERLQNTALNSLWNKNGHSDVDVEPYHSRGSLPRSGFDGTRGLRTWDDRPISTSTTTTSTRRPATISAANTDEYDYYDELEKHQTSTTRSPWKIDYRRTTEIPTTSSRSFEAPTVRSDVYDPWTIRSPSTTSTTARSPYTAEYPPGSRYKPYDEDRDFKEWKSQVEQQVQRMRRPSGKTKTPGSRMRVTGSPSLENDLVPLFKVSGIEEEDWKFVHETNTLEDTFKPGERFGSGRYRSEWDTGVFSDWRTDRRGSRNDDSSLGASRRTTRTTEPLTKTEPPSSETWPQTTTTPRIAGPESSTSLPKVFVPPTRRFVPRKPVVLRRRTTPRSRSGPKYRFRLYTPSESISQDVPSEGSISAAAKAPTPRSEQTFSTTTTSSPVTSERATEPSYPFNENTPPKIAAVTAPRRTTSTPESITFSSLPTTLPIIPISTSYSIPTSPSTTTTVRPSSTTTPASTAPIEIHWLTTRRPVFGEGMSIDEQLAEAMKRLQERQRAKELENQKKNAEREERKQQFDGSGDWENEILNDAPVIVESVPEVADLNLQNDIAIENDFRGRVVEDGGDDEISGELLKEHIMHVDAVREPPKSHGRKSGTLRTRTHA